MENGSTCHQQSLNLLAENEMNFINLVQCVTCAVSCIYWALNIPIHHRDATPPTETKQKLKLMIGKDFIKVVTMNPIIMPYIVIQSLQVSFFIWFIICTVFSVAVVLLDFCIVDIDDRAHMNVIVAEFPERQSILNLLTERL